MKLPISWLKDFIDINLSTEELCEKLVSAGFEVEEVLNRGKDLKNIKAGRIISTEKHTNADKLTVCQIDVGRDRLLQIVTGAKNIKTNDLVPVVLDGGVVAGGKKIVKGELRGVLSEGMLCSGAELGITEDDYTGASVDGILLLKEEDFAVGDCVTEKLELDEDVLDVSITANRPDCQSIIGLAREVAAITGKPLKPLNINFKDDNSDNIKNYVKVNVLNNDLCPRYMAKAVKDIKIVKSPDIIRKRLIACGLRPINSIVDITNYVLLEIGQPMHAFDLNYLNGNEINVRRAKDNESIVTLNGQTTKLDNDVLVICDSSKPVAVAGIMGGEHSGVKAETSTIIFESAKFARDNIRKSSKRISLRSDASSRYEKGIDSASCEFALKRALNIIETYNLGTIVGGAIDIYSEKAVPRVMEVQLRDIDALLGIKVDRNRMLEILNGLQIKSELSESGVLTCTIPEYREDIEAYPDIAEEIIRLYGYNHIKSTMLKKAAVTSGGRTDKHYALDRIKAVNEGLGFHELLTYAFIPAGAASKLLTEKENSAYTDVVISNPLNENYAVMRRTLLHSALNVASLNLSRKNNSGKFYEIANIYLSEGNADKLPIEKERLILLSYGENEDFFTMKAVLDAYKDQLGVKYDLRRSKRSFLHNGRSADILCNGKEIGYFGEIHPDVAKTYDIKQRIYVLDCDIELLLKNIKPYSGYNVISKYPHIERDLAIIVKDNVSNAELIANMKKFGKELLKNVELFDCYKGDQIGKGLKSMAYTLIFRDDEKTLTSEKADELMDSIIDALKILNDAKLR